MAATQTDFWQMIETLEFKSTGKKKKKANQKLKSKLLEMIYR